MLEIDHLAFEDKPARVLSFIWLLSLSLLSRICRKPCSILFRSISAFSIDVACTIDFKCPHKWKSNGFKSGERSIHLFAKCWFKNYLATRPKCGGAPSCINRVRSLTSTKTCSNISCKRVLEKSTYFVPVSFPSRGKGPIKNLSIIPTHTFKLVLMSWMHNNMWVFFVPIMIIMKIEYTIPGETSLLEFALFIKFIISHKGRQI